MHFNNSLLKFLLLSTSLFSANANLANIYNECKKPGQVALTIDDGPHNKLTPKLLDLLKREGVKATFFINGKNYGRIEENAETQAIIKRQIREGHDIGSHTFFHKKCFTAYGDGTLKENIERLENGIKKIANLTPRFFRPPEGEGGFSKEYCEKIHIPYDSRTEIIRGILGGDGYRYGPNYGDYDYDIILWNADTEDWKCNGSSIKVKDSIASLDYSMGPEKANPSKNSFIVLVHDVHEYSVNNVIPEVIKHVKELGYQFVSLSECIGRDPYKEPRSNFKDDNGTINIETKDTDSSGRNVNFYKSDKNDANADNQGNTEINPIEDDKVITPIDATSEQSNGILNGNENIGTDPSVTPNVQDESSAISIFRMTFSTIVFSLIMVIYYHL